MSECGEDCDSKVESIIDGPKTIGELNSISCTCCTACSRRRGKTGQRPNSFDQVKTVRGQNMRVKKRLAGLVKGKEGRSEAMAILRHLHKDFPDTKVDSVSNLSVLNLIKNLRLSYNQVSL